MEQVIGDPQRAWYILDEIAVECSNRGLYPLSDKAVEAMVLLPKPSADECKELHNERQGHKPRYSDGPGNGFTVSYGRRD